jgi:hypothetical protein
MYVEPSLTAEESFGMGALHFNRSISDDRRRSLLYQGDLFVYSPNAGSQALCGLARRLCEEAFRPHSPETAQHELPLERFVAILTELKPKFIHHPEAKGAIQVLLRGMGCDPDKTYFDVPRLRTSTSDNYLTSGIAYAFHPHRDTWYSAPMSQINWWLPVYDVEPGNVMALHPNYWSRPVRNGSAGYDYHEWVQKSRFTANTHVGKDTRKQPHPEEPMELEPDVRVVPEVAGMLLFSAAQMHSSVPNVTGRTRVSIDFRTIHIGDLEEIRGAPNMDSECTGSNLRDFLRVADFAHASEELAARYDEGAAKLFPLGAVPAS